MVRRPLWWGLLLLAGVAGLAGAETVGVRLTWEYVCGAVPGRGFVVLRGLQGGPLGPLPDGVLRDPAARQYVDRVPIGPTTVCYQVVVLDEEDRWSPPSNLMCVLFAPCVLDVMLSRFTCQVQGPDRKSVV